jgi:hypothetical protein
MKLKLATPLLAALAACSSSPGTPTTDGGNPDGGPPPGTPIIYSLDGIQTDPSLHLSLAIGPNDRVGVAYFRGVSGSNYEVRYVEWQNGNVSNSEVVQSVQRVSDPMVCSQCNYGVSLAFQSNGQPAVSYLGGGDDGTGSLFWKQSDAMISYRQSSGSWQEQTVVRMSNEAYCNLTGGDNNPSNIGFVVGLFPALGFVGTTAHLAYRDVHGGQFPFQDWNASDLEVASGGGSTWNHRPIVCGGDDKKAYGGHTQMVIAQGQPAVVSDEIFNSADGTGKNVLFHRRNSDGSWTGTAWSSPVISVDNTQAGPSLAYDSTAGYLIAVTDRTSNTLLFTSSTNGTTWTVATPVVQEGTTGWYPSVAIDPSAHEPSIAYYHCANRTGVAESSCPANENQLRLMYRVSGSIWRGPTLLDSQGGVFPKLGFLSNGRMVVAYRHPATGVLKLYLGP